MALVPSVLEAGLLSVLTSKPRAAAQAARLMANAYADYTRTAQAGTALPVFLGTESQGLQQALLSAMAAPSAGNPSLMANAWFTGVTAFWTTSFAPVIFSDGVNTGPPLPAGASSVVGCLTPVFSNVANTDQSAASQMAACIDTATRAITVTLLPSGVTVPLS